MTVAESNCYDLCVREWSYMRDCPAVDKLIVHDQPGLQAILEYLKCPLSLTLYSRPYGHKDDHGIKITIEAVE